MSNLTKSQKTYLIVHTVLSLLGFILLLFLIDMLNLRTAGVVLSFIFYGCLVASVYLLIKQKWFYKVIAVVVLQVLVFVMLFTLGPVTEFKTALEGEVVAAPVVSVEGGDIQGVANNEVEVYLGIPYAKAPIGELRWKEPQDVEAWEGVKDCSHFGPWAMQSEANSLMNSLQDLYLEKGWHLNLKSESLSPISEDCLYLNVYKPKNADVNTPVLVYYHGGSLTSGSTDNADINGVDYAKRGVIFVTVAYRLNVFGYLALPELKEESPNSTTGNYGLLDQVRALKWVNDNIAKFNGDKNNITIAGESAGSSSVSALCSTPLAKGLFKKAIGESSSVVVKVPPHTFRDLSKAYETGNSIKQEFNCTTLDEMRAIPAEELVKTKYANSGMTVDGYALPKTPYEVYLAGEENEEILLNGCNAYEADAFILLEYLLDTPKLKNYKERLQTVFGDKLDELLAIYDGQINTDEDAEKVFNEIISAYWFVYPHESWSTMAYNNSKKVYRYFFTKENGYMSAWHSGEIIYAYGNVKNSKKPYRYDASDEHLSEMMSEYFINFIKYDNPNGLTLPEWSEWTPENHRVMEFGDNVQMIDDPYLKLYDFMASFDTFRLANK